MKKLIVLLVMIASGSMLAQDLKDDSSYITLYGNVEIPTTIKSYRSKIELSLKEAHYSNPGCYENLEEMIETFFTKLEKAGIKRKDVTEIKLEFLKSGRRTEGTMLQYVDTDQEKITAFNSVTMAGVYPQTIEYELESDDSDFKKNLSETMNKLKEQAKMLANELDLKIKKVAKVNLSQSRSRKQYSTYIDDEFVSLYVIYELQ